MDRQDKIALNFIPVTQPLLNFSIYRRRYIQGDTKETYPTAARYNLPQIKKPESDDNKYVSYWVSYDSLPGFEAFSCDIKTNNFLTQDFLYRLLSLQCRNVLTQAEYEEEDGFRKRRISFILKRYSEGYQAIWLEPYYLRIADKFGFLLDFKFFAPMGTKSNKRLQQLSLSLDKNGRSNQNYYADRFEQVLAFLAMYHARLFPLLNNNLEISVAAKLFELDAEALEPKTYVFGSDKTGTSPFKGIQTHGPLKNITSNSKVYFLFREKDRPFSHELFRALRGETYPSTFPGMERMFKYKFDSSNVSGAPIADYTPEAIQQTLRIIQNDAGNRRVVPVLLIPFNRYIGDEERNKKYNVLKHAFLKHKFPSQFVSLILLQQRNQLKWSVGNIGLGLFAKMGGEPWKVVPKTDKCLIFGIGQAHKEKDDRIEKYFAYSILTESNGLYKELKILSQATEEGDYLTSFKQNLEALFKKYYEAYDHFVVHTSFRIRGVELDALKEVLNGLQTEKDSPKQFVVMKFNDQNRYFGYARNNNSLVPFEGSFLRLSNREFLVWFEGLQYHNPTVRKRYERPLHIEFIYPENRHDKSGLEPSEQIRFLQDAINISGANWRGFIAKSLPVSIYYAKIVADFYSDFESLDLEELNFEDFAPWFL